METKEPDRQTWTRQIQFLFVMVGQGVGFGNVWRFPYVCYRNGGGVFLIPYIIAVFLLGIPLCVLEGCLGQFMSRGTISAYKIVPLFQGIAYMMAVVGYFTMCYYSVLFAWVLYYLFASMSAVLPWSNCDNDWNTPACRVYSSVTNCSAISSLIEECNATVVTSKINISTDPATEFWERKVLRLSAGIDQPGTVKWDLALALLLSWIIIYFCIWKGTKWIGKLSYVTASAPYLFLVLLLVRGATLKGAASGIFYYLSPDWSKLLDGKVWSDACSQVFYSYCVGVSVHTAIASCNEFNHNIVKHYFLFALINSTTSFLFGFVIFSVLGFMAANEGVSVDHVAESGPGLAFIVYPQAISQMPVPQLWAILFFLMLLFVSIDSEFSCVESVVISVMDLFPKRHRSGRTKEIFTAVYCSLCFLVGLSCVTEGGVYMEQVFEWYVNGKILFIVAFLECIVVAYFYGANRFQKNLEYMLGYRIGPLFKYLWLTVTPAICLILFITDVILYPDLVYERKSGVYIFPTWSRGLGWTLALSAILWVPGVMVWKMCSTPGTACQRVRRLLQPEFTEIQAIRDRGVLGHIIREPETIALKM